MYATLNNFRGSPRKFNEYLRAVRGMLALVAAEKLKFVSSPYAEALRKLINSAVANATQDPEIRAANLILNEATVGRAMFLKRIKFHGKGKIGRVTKFGSNVRVVLKNLNTTNHDDNSAINKEVVKQKRTRIKKDLVQNFDNSKKVFAKKIQSFQHFNRKTSNSTKGEK